MHGHARWRRLRLVLSWRVRRDAPGAPSQGRRNCLFEGALARSRRRRCPPVWHSPTRSSNPATSTRRVPHTRRWTSGAAEPHARYGLGRSARPPPMTTRPRPASWIPPSALSGVRRGLVCARHGRCDSSGASTRRGTRWQRHSSTARGGRRWTIPSSHACAPCAMTPRRIPIARSRFRREGETARAIEEYEAAVAADPKWVRARVNLIALYCRERQWREGRRAFQGAGRSRTARRRGTLQLRDLPRLARRHREGGRRIPDGAGDQSAVRCGLVGLAQLAERDGRLDEAEASYRKAAEQAPDDATTQFNLARMMLARRDSQQAIAVLERIATRDDPNRARVLFALATAHVQAGDVAAAVVMRSRHATSRDRAGRQIWRPRSNGIWRRLP